MRFNTSKTLGLVTGLGTSLLLSALTSSAFAMSPFQANYQFEYNGKNMGSATRTLSKTSANGWKYVFSAKAGVVASATETSNFTFTGGQIRSDSFSRTSKILVHSNTMSIKFNPSAKTINTVKDKEKRSFAWKTGALDELNAELQIREDLKSSGLKSSYPLTDAKEVELRQFVKSGTEKIQTKYGTFDTVKVIIKHKKPGRDTTFWLAPKLDYLPVKVTHQDKNNSYGLLLTGYKGASN